MKKSKYIVIVAIVVILVIITSLIVWSYEQPKASITLYSNGEKVLYSNGEKVDNTGFYFAGFTYRETPLPNSHLALYVVFKPTSKYATHGELEPTELLTELNPNGNSSFYLGSEYTTIVSYNVAR